MNHTETLTRYVANFVDELITNGIRHVVISPGSRSTPLSLAFAEHDGVKEWVIIDERSAGFFALGLAKQKQSAVALVCTSGSAAANYFPAVVEAYHSRVPLVVLTADRPHELRDVGAPQAIDQLKLYGSFTKWFHEMALPEATADMLNYARRNAARAVYIAEEGNPGPVQLNFPFREPLPLDFSLEDIWENGSSDRKNQTAPIIGKKQLTEEQLAEFLQRLTGLEKGLIVCGPQVDGEILPEKLAALSEKWTLPILADPLSQLRHGPHRKENIIETYDALLKNEKVREQMKPDFIIRFGAMPVSKSYLFYMKENKDVPQFVVESDQGYREPTGNVTDFIYADPVDFCDALLEMEAPRFSEAWLERWQQMNTNAKKHLTSGNDAKLTEGDAVRALSEVIPEQSILYVGNSMPIRDVDTFFLNDEKKISILGNRGANGIDGTISSAAGAAASGKRVTLVIGDLAFFHDMNGLHPIKHYGFDMTILLINNNGGGIFSFLPQAEDKKHFEALFGTPLHLDFRKAAELYGAEYTVSETEKDLKNALQASYGRRGLSIIEVQTDREENVRWHREKWRRIAEDVSQNEG